MLLFWWRQFDFTSFLYLEKMIFFFAIFILSRKSLPALSFCGLRYIEECYSRRDYDTHFAVDKQSAFYFVRLLPTTTYSLQSRLEYIIPVIKSQLFRCVRQERISIRGSVRPSVSPSVCPSVTPVQKWRFPDVFGHDEILLSRKYVWKHL